MNIPSLTLRDGRAIPSLAFGSGTAWMSGSSNPGALTQIVKAAIQKGFHHLDCAEMYGTDEEVGVAIKESGVPREKLFVTHKASNNMNDIPGTIEKSLKNMQLDYFDLYLIHSPHFAKSDADLQKAWKAMEDIKKAGKARSIGVSNYLRPQIEATLKTAVDPPVINQLEYHPYLQRANGFVPWLQQNGIQVASYKGLTPAVRAPDGPLHEPLARMAKAHGRNVSPSAILLAWLLQTGVVAVTTTSKAERLDEYAQALDVALTPEELREISEIGATYHLRTSWVNHYDQNDRS